GTQSTSPEVITSLVESLSKISSPNASLYGTSPEISSSSLASSMLPRDMDYEFVHGGLHPRDYRHLHPDDAALAPVVRTAKPPSGLNPLTSGEETHNKRLSYTAVDIPSY